MRRAGVDPSCARPQGATRALALGFLAQNITVSLTFGVYGVFVHFFAETFDIGRTVASAGLPIVILTMGLINPAMGWLINRHGIRRLMPLGALLMSAGFLGAAAAPVAQAVLASFVLVGLGSALMGTLPATTLVSNWYDKTRGRAIGLVNVPLGAVIMPPVAVLMFQTLGWRTSFVCFAMVLVLLAPILRLVRDRPEEPDVDAAVSRQQQAKAQVSVRSLFLSPFFWLATLSAGMILASGSARSVHIVPYATSIGIDPASASILMSVSAGFAIPGALLFGALSDRLGGGAALAMNGLIQVIGWSLLLYCGPQFVMLACSIALLGLCSGGVYVALSTMFSIHYGSRMLGTALGSASALKLPFTFSAPLVIAFLFDLQGDYTVAFLGVLVLVGVCAAIFGTLAVIQSRETARSANAAVGGRQT